MTKKKDPQGILWDCAACRGRLVSSTIVRSIAGKNQFYEWTQSAAANSGTDGKSCPMCYRAMVTGFSKTEGVDLCQNCQVVWFDEGEFEQLPKHVPITLSDLSVEERVEIGTARIQSVKDQSSYVYSPTPNEPIKYLFGIMGLPVEFGSHSIKTPRMTIFLAATTFVFSLVGFYSPTLTDEYAFLPDDMWRHFGLTFITPFFLHANWIHLLSNLYFLISFGNDVEDYLGAAQYFFLVMGASILGVILHAMGDPRPEVYLVGASAGIAGIMAFYALQLPKRDIGIFLFYGLYGRWIRIPAWSAFGLWALWQFVGSLSQARGASSVSSFGHIGGAVAGLLFWWIWRINGSHTRVVQTKDQ